MELDDIASVAGKGGLFRILKPTRNGVILETLDDNKKKLIAHSNQRVSALKEISIFTHTQEGSVPLENIFKKIYEDFGDDPGIDNSSSSEELRSFMQHIEPEFDREKVYVSDIKRLVSWYKIILKEAPEILTSSEKTAQSKNEDEKSSES